MKPSREVLEDALRQEPESHERWDHVLTLHKRGDQESFLAAAELLDSRHPERRALGVDVLAQLGAAPDVPAEQRPLAGPGLELLLQRIGSETDPDVLQSMAMAFGHLPDSESRAAAALHALRVHPDEDVRYAVVFGLLRREDDLAVDALVELSRDPDSDVRDWATFGLGAQIDRDDAQVRDALVARLDDPDENTREEALSGLAARGDERAIPRLLIELATRSGLGDSWLVDDALLELAARTRDPRLCPHVEALWREWTDTVRDEPMPDNLSAAMKACE